MKINVQLKNSTDFVNIDIDDIKKIILVNGENRNIDVNQFVSRLLRVVSSFSNSVRDPLQADFDYKIFIEKDNKTYTYLGYTGDNVNYLEFSNLLKEVL